MKVDEQQLEVLASRAWQHLDQARSAHAGVVPQDCAPVLYFGDLPAYLRSPIRVITVGLNPSDREFPAPDPWLRFPGADDRSSYLASLDRYFVTEPLNWFKCWRELLHGLDACFWPHQANTALHTDLGSVVPTNPTWSRLTTAQRTDLMERGVPLWHELVATLEPQVIVTSVRYEWLELILLSAESDWRVIHTVPRPRPYLVEARDVMSSAGVTCLLIRGRAANTPFGTVKNVDRLAIGRSIRSIVSP